MRSPLGTAYFSGRCDGQYLGAGGDLTPCTKGRGCGLAGCPFARLKN